MNLYQCVVESPHCDSFHLPRLTSLTKLDRHRDFEIEMYFSSASGFGRTLIQGQNFFLNQQCTHRVVQACTMKLALMYKIKVWPTGNIESKCIFLFLFHVTQFTYELPGVPILLFSSGCKKGQSLLHYRVTLQISCHF